MSPIVDMIKGKCMNFKLRHYRKSGLVKNTKAQNQHVFLLCFRASVAIKLLPKAKILLCQRYPHLQTRSCIYNRGAG